MLRIFTFLNLIAYAIYDYSERIPGLEVNQDINEISKNIEIICNIFFLIEMIINIVSMGFVIEKGSYLRNYWNIINFISVVSRYNFFFYYNNSIIIIITITINY